MKLTDHFDTHPETGRAMLPPAETLQEDHDAPPSWLPVIIGLTGIFWAVVLWAVVA